VNPESYGPFHAVEQHHHKDSHLKGQNSLDSNSFNSGIQDMNIKHEMESLGSENHSDKNITENQLPGMLMCSGAPDLSLGVKMYLGALDLPLGVSMYLGAHHNTLKMWRM
jgi:hypothetical protein